MHLHLHDRAAPGGHGRRPPAAPATRRGLQRSLLLIGLAAGSSLIGLHILHREAEELTDQIVTQGRPARELLGEIQLTFSGRTYDAREYLITGDERYLDLYRRVTERERGLRERLTVLLDELEIEPTVRDDAERLLSSWTAAQERRLAEAAGDPGETGEEMPRLEVDRDSLHAETLAALSVLRDEINVAISSRLDGIRRTETAQLLIAMTLAVLSLSAALERTRLARLERSARAEAERRARDEAALREAARAVASAETVAETVQRIADSALTSIDAEAAVVERMDAQHGEVEIVARSGSCGPSLGERIDYAGSAARKVSEERGSVQWEGVGEDGWGAPYLAGRCAGGKIIAVPLFDDETPTGCLVLIRNARGPDFDDDETERIRTFADLAALEFNRMTLLAESERRRLELERVSESRARLIRGFSHDVKNALGAADGYAQLLEDGVVGDPSPQQSPMIAHLRTSLGGAMKLTRDLMHLAHAEAGEILVERVRTDVGSLVQDVTNAYWSLSEAEGVEVTVDVEKGLPAICSDPARIQQVLGNLLSNAVNYTPAGGHVLVVARRCAGRPESRPGAWLCISVTDDGPGIPTDQQRRVFDEFVRLDPESGAGSGLGLAISRRIAAALGGDLTLTSAPGVGSEFTLWLPLEPTAASGVRRADTDIRKQA